MIKEWKWNSKSGKAFFRAGVGMQDAVGAPKPSEAVPLQEGLRVLFSRGVDHIWAIILASAFLRLLGRKLRKK